jgi:hypothetical protein
MRPNLSHSIVTYLIPKAAICALGNGVTVLVLVASGGPGQKDARKPGLNTQHQTLFGFRRRYAEFWRFASACRQLKQRELRIWIVVASVGVACDQTNAGAIECRCNVDRSAIDEQFYLSRVERQ